MQNKPTIKLRLARLSNAALVSFADSLVTNMTGSAFYPSPNPALATVSADNAVYATKVAAWGTTGNRGSHQTYIELLAARAIVETDLTALANYCETTTPYNEPAFASCGWEIKNPKSLTGPLPPIQNLHQFLSKTINYGEAKIRWKRPLDTAYGVVYAYNVYRNTLPNFNAAALIQTITKTSFIDTGLTLTSYYYWVVPIGVAGPGVVSDLCLVSVALLP